MPEPSPEAGGRPGRGRLGAVTLRARLLAALLALLAAVSVVVGVVSVLALDRSVGAGHPDRHGGQRHGGHRHARQRHARQRHGGAGGRAAAGAGRGGAVRGHLGARIVAGSVVEADGAGGTMTLTAEQRSALRALPVDARPHTRDLGGDLGRYRLRATSRPGDGTVFVTGLPLSGVRDTVTRLGVVIAAVAAAGLLLAGIAGAAIVRLALRPLRRVAATATRVSELPLDRGAVELSERVPATDTDPRTEVGLELPDQPVEVPGDADRLHQVVGNLLGNARTHTPPGTTVTVRLSTSDGAVLLRVADDGPGIPPDLLPRVFQRFARGDSSRSRAAGSTGLGLAIVAAVTDAHGGTVAVDSSPAGTAFTVRLPATGVSVGVGPGG